MNEEDKKKVEPKITISLDEFGDVISVKYHGDEKSYDTNEQRRKEDNYPKSSTYICKKSIGELHIYRGPNGGIFKCPYVNGTPYCYEGMEEVQKNWYKKEE